MVAPAQVYAAFWFDRDEQDRFFRRLGRTLSISLLLHVVVLLIVMGIRLAPHGERPADGKKTAREQADCSPML